MCHDFKNRSLRDMPSSGVMLGCSVVLGRNLMEAGFSIRPDDLGYLTAARDPASTDAGTSGWRLTYNRQRTGRITLNAVWQHDGS